MDKVSNSGATPHDEPRPLGVEQIDAIIHGAAAQPTEAERQRQQLVAHYQKCYISVNDPISPDVNTLTIGGVATCAREGLHFVKAKAKQGKTSGLCIVESVFVGPFGQWGQLRRISDAPLKVRHIDTEQKPYDSLCFKRQMLRLAGISEHEAADTYRIMNLRSVMDNRVKQALIETMVQEERPDVLVIDGIVDLINDFNDVEQSKALIAWLMHLADEYHLVLFGVLHTNKNEADKNMRGHLGTLAEQKCDTTLECEKDDQHGIVSVKCAVSRHRPFPAWHFTWDIQGNLIDADMIEAAHKAEQTTETKMSKAEKHQMIVDERKSQMEAILKAHGGKMPRIQLVDELQQKWQLKQTSVYITLKQWEKCGFIELRNDTVKLVPNNEPIG